MNKEYTLTGTLHLVNTLETQSKQKKQKPNINNANIDTAPRESTVPTVGKAL